MSFVDIVKKRRSYYSINKDLGGVTEEEIVEMVEELTKATPDAYNMRSARAVVVFGEKHDKLWDTIYDTFGGKVKREKIDTFKNGYGTILFYIENKAVKASQDALPSYAENFAIWSNQANAMLQYIIWIGLRDKGLGASLQHYNPVIDENLAKMFDIPESWGLLAQMPFGGIEEEVDPKDPEDISKRVIIK